MNVTYRCAPRCFLAGVLVLVVSFAMGVVCPFAVRDAKEAEKLPAGLATGAVSLALFVLAIAVFRHARRHRLTLSDTYVESIGVWDTKRIALDQVARVRWRRMGEKGVVTLESPGGKLSIDLGHYARGDLREVIRFFRRRLPASIQEGWSTFWRQYYRLFDDPDPARREEFAANTRALRWRLCAWCLMGALVIGAAGAAVWAHTGEALFAAAPLAVLLIWPATWFARADRGRLREKHDVRLKAHPLIVAGIAVLLLSELVFLPLGFYGVRIGLWIFQVGMFVAIAMLVLGVVAQVEQLLRNRQAAADEAERLYLDGPPNAATRR